MKKKKIFLMLFTILFLFLPTKNILALEEAGTFTDLQTLVNNFTGKTLVLQKDYKNSGSESQIVINKNIVIDLNGHVINANFKSNVFYVSNGYSLTIEDSNKNAIHKFDVDEWLLATLNEEAGTLTIKGGCITGGNYDARNSVGAAVHLNNGTLILNSGNIVGNKISGKYQYGAGIGAEDNSTVIINDGMVSYNSAAWECYGGGIYLNNSNLTINGGTISYNYGIYGGGINAYDGSNLVVNDGIISNNIAGHNGGGIALMVLDSKVAEGVISKATIKGGIIENNTVKTPWIGVGGGIATCKGANLTITGGTIQKNTATRGGGVGAWTGGIINIFGGKISQNVSSEDTTPGDGSVGNHGAGVFFNTYFISGYGSVDAQLNIGGNAVITGNVNAVSNKEDNLYIANGQKLIIDRGIGAPKNGMNVSINMENYGDFTTNGGLKDAKYFSVDDADYYIKYESDSLKAVKIDSKPKYEVISGANQTYIIGKNKEATFKIDADYYLFKGKIYVDDTLLESKNYTSEEGSTIIKLKKEFVDSLKVGEHILKVSFSDSGEATTNFVVDILNENNTLNEENPKTGDDVVLYFIINCISLIILAGCCFYLNRKRFN